NFATRSVVMRSEDPSLTGVVEPDGTVRVFEVASNKEILHTEKGFDFLNRKTGVDPGSLGNIQRIDLVADAKSLYLACSGPPDPAVMVMSNLWPGLGLRALPINGRLYAYDRARGDFKYYVSAPNQMLMLDRFREMPMLLFTARYQGGVPGRVGFGGQTTSASLLAVDKRTGKTLHQIVNKQELYQF